MRFVPRLLPILIGAAALLLCAKIVDFWLAIGIDPLATAHAQTAPAPKTPATTAPTTTAPTTTAPGASPPETAKSSRTAAADPAPPAGKRATRDPMAFSPQEVEILQSLAQRRDELDRRSAEVDRHEALLQATEQRIDEKIAKLQQMQGTINESFKKEDQKDDAKLKSLVKIYETMKPKEAARIFEQLDLPVLLDVLERMKEMKTAPILASMDPVKAKAVTLALAARHPPLEMKQ